MNDQEKRIKLAEAVGWKWIFGSGANGYWIAPGGMKTDWIVVDDRYALLPDPENDANACNALIKHLNGLGWLFHRQDHDKNGKYHRTQIEFYRTKATSWKNDSWWGDADNWMHGVCELALKVIE